MPGGMMWGPGWWGPGYGFFGWLMMLIFWILIIAGAALVIRWLVTETGSRGAAGGDTTLDILKRRYAKGEITKDQFLIPFQDLS